MVVQDHHPPYMKVEFYEWYLKILNWSINRYRMVNVYHFFILFTQSLIVYQVKMSWVSEEKSMASNSPMYT